jgi:hypothetical protein
VIVLEQPVPVHHLIVGRYAKYTVVKSKNGDAFEYGLLPYEEQPSPGEATKAYPLYFSKAARDAIMRQLLRKEP